MNALNETLDKLFTEVDHLGRLTEAEELSPTDTQLALSIAKRVRRTSTIAVKLLASQRDQLQPNGGTST